MQNSFIVLGLWVPSLIQTNSGFQYGSMWDDDCTIDLVSLLHFSLDSVISLAYHLIESYI